MDRPQVAAVLRAGRDRLKPADVGLPGGHRRRVPGLRREEVALLAGISVDYLVRLEQGRGPQPSVEVLAALARALRLSDDERDHLFDLAGEAPPRSGRIDDLVHAATLRLLERLVDLPALLLDAKGDVLAWNDMALALVGDLTRLPRERRNLARFKFLGGPSRVVFDSPAEEERAAVAAVGDLRATAARYPNDPGLKQLLDDLLRGDDRFARLWADAQVERRRRARKSFAHPAVGRVTLDCDVLLLPDSDQRLVVYSAEPGSAAAEALALLRVVGVQDLAPSR